MKVYPDPNTRSNWAGSPLATTNISRLYLNDNHYKYFPDRFRSHVPMFSGRFMMPGCPNESKVRL